jgi:hypothetical protein
MANFTEQTEYRPAGRVRPCRHFLLWLGLAMMLCLPGCGGCSKTPDDADKEKRQAEEKAGKKKEKEKDRFEAKRPAVMPPGKDLGACKPGHWISQVWPDVTANRGDFQGELVAEITDHGSRKAPLRNVAYEITTQRPAPLAKEQPKSLESFVWVPSKDENAEEVNIRLTAGRGGPGIFDQILSLRRMPSYQYFFVVLAQPADRYEYLDKKLLSIHQVRPTPDEDDGTRYYEVVSLPTSRRPNLPSNALYWTSIAYLFWDNCDPALLDLEQQQALVDWLHWGGQIIVSGPDALEQLRNSFLGPYLPATAGKARSISAGDLAELSYWSSASKVFPPLAPKAVKDWAGAELKKDPRAVYLPYTGDLLVERQVGRGRIVASAFRLSGPELTNWEGFDCLFNACLLRHPAREFPTDADPGDKSFRWAGTPPSSHRLDAAKMTAVRYFARDAGVAWDEYAADIKDALEDVERSGTGQPWPRVSTGPAPMPPGVAANGAPMNGGVSLSTADEDAPIPLHHDVAPGLAAWNDFSPVADAAKRALLDASGIKVPERSFIVWVLVGYLCVLVPLNWMIFRLLGRVEWAWIAAPLIAIGCTVVVIDLAQLNIGFARSRNEIVVVEMQAGYSRVHVARYTALYTSLGTRYEFHLDDPAAQILPLANSEDHRQLGQPAFGETRGELFCRRGDDTQLTGFTVASNATDYMHSEEMRDFGGTVALHHDSDGVLRVTNGTPHPLDACQAVRGLEPNGGESPGFDLAQIGALEPGATAALKFEYQPPRKKAARTNIPVEPEGTTPDRSQRVAADRAKEESGGLTDNRPEAAEPTGELKIEGIVDAALDNQELRPGEVCLLARIMDEVPGLTITPSKSQTRQAALLVAHLDAGRIAAPEADTKVAVSNPRGVDPRYINPSGPRRRRIFPFPAKTTPDTPTPKPDDTDPFNAP